jgi:hypothetical protein
MAAAEARQRRARGQPGGASDRIKISRLRGRHGRALETRNTARDEVYGISGGGLEGRTALSRLWGRGVRENWERPSVQTLLEGRPAATQRRGGVAGLGDTHGRINSSGGLGRCVTLRRAPDFSGERRAGLRVCGVDRVGVRCGWFGIAVPTASDLGFAVYTIPGTAHHLCQVDIGGGWGCGARFGSRGPRRVPSTRITQTPCRRRACVGVQERR